MNWLKRRIENQSIGLVPILLFMALDNIFAYQLSFFVAIAFCVLSLGIYYSLRRERVYLYMLFLSKHDKDIKINDLSKKLVLPVKTIQDAVKYWEEQGLITRKNTGYIVNSIQEIELHKVYKPKTALSAEQLQKSAENQKRAKAIEFINNKYFSGLMPTTWYPEIELWFKKLCSSSC